MVKFTIDGTAYYDDEGMTWLEWVNSDHNTDGYQDLYKDSECITADDTNYIVSSGSKDVMWEEEIIHNYNYVLRYDFAPI